MVKVQLFGMARWKAGVASLEVDEHNVPTLGALKKQLPGFTSREAADLLVLVNGRNVKRNYRFQNGDLVVFLSPVGGG